jgi:VanZ family protein
MCVALIVYASLYPFDHWRDQGIGSWSFMAAPWPKYWLGFDVVANVLGYAPLGFFLTLSAMRMGWRTHVVVLATLAAAVLSFTMEGLQSYLPSRVPSLPDFLLNTLGLSWGPCWPVRWRVWVSCDVGVNFENAGLCAMPTWHWC